MPQRLHSFLRALLRSCAFHRAEPARGPPAPSIASRPAWRAGGRADLRGRTRSTCVSQGRQRAGERGATVVGETSDRARVGKHTQRTLNRPPHYLVIARCRASPWQSPAGPSPAGRPRDRGLMLIECCAMQFAAGANQCFGQRTGTGCRGTGCRGTYYLVLVRTFLPPLASRWSGGRTSRVLAMAPRPGYVQQGCESLLHDRCMGIGIGRCRARTLRSRLTASSHQSRRSINFKRKCDHALAAGPTGAGVRPGSGTSPRPVPGRLERGRGGCGGGDEWRTPVWTYSPTCQPPARRPTGALPICLRGSSSPMAWRPPWPWPRWVAWNRCV
jgi:hypothetical protein